MRTRFLAKRRRRGAFSYGLAGVPGEEGPIRKGTVRVKTERVSGLPLLLLVLWAALAACPLGAEPAYDVVVVGAGPGGAGAAIAAARLGARVALLEETAVVGGQMTASAVSTMDDMYGNRTGLYGEFYDRVRAHYAALGKSVGTCYWETFTFAFEPSVGASLLEEMIAGASVDLFLRARVTAVLRDGDAVTGVRAVIDGKERTLTASVVVDGTEWGDLLPLAGAAYRVGRNVVGTDGGPPFDGDSRIQDITWVTVLKHYPGGVPRELRVTLPPPGYDDWVGTYRNHLARDGAPFSGYPVRLPVDFPTHNGYRGLPDSSAPGRADSSSPLSLQMLTKSGVNWGNDYPGEGGYEGKSGLPVTYLEDGSFRRRAQALAMIKTIGFLHYVQNELGLPWSVADDEFDDEATWDAVSPYLPPEYASLARRFPPQPYVREGRRLVGVETLTSARLRANSESYRDGTEGREEATAVATGRYILDLHGADETEELEAEFQETHLSIAGNKPLGPFQVPLAIFIPERIDGLLAAEKNLSMTRLAAGALRLQPISMATGQAVGVLAALAAEAGFPPRAIDPLKVQRRVVQGGSRIALALFSDVPEDHPLWPAVQIATVRGWIDPLALPTSPAMRIDDRWTLLEAARKGRTKGVFGVDRPLSLVEGETLLRRALNREKPLKGLLNEGAHLELATLVRALEGESGRRRDVATVLDDFAGRGLLAALGDGGPLDGAVAVTRGQAADIVLRFLTE